MKKFFHLSTVLLALALATASCVSEKTDFKPDNGNTDGKAVGYLSFAETGLSVITDEEARPDEPSPKAAADVNAFTVEVFNAEGTSVMKSLYGELPAEPVELPVGSYTIKAYSGIERDADWEAPYYAAQQEFAITKGATTALGQIVCKLSNIKVTVGYSADLLSELEAGSHTTVTVEPHTLEFDKDEQRAGYLKAVAPSNTMLVEIDLVRGGRTSRMTSEIPDVKAGQWRKISVNKTASEEGRVQFSLRIETVTIDERISVDVTTQLVEEVIREEDPQAPAIVWQQGDIDTPYRLLKAMFDAEGNYADPFDVTISSEKSTIAKAEVLIASTSAEFLSSLTTMGITTSFDLCTVTQQSAPVLNSALKLIGFRTGAEVLGQASVSFDLKRAMGLLYQYDGDHSFRLTVTDADGRITEKTLAVTVDKVAEGGTAADGPTIAWIGRDIDQTYEVASDLEVKIDVQAPAGIAGFVVDIDSDVLTDDVLGMLKLGRHIDLIEPGEMEAMLSAPFPEGLGFPVKDDVRNQTAVLFDISNFMQMILDLGMPGFFNFRITVTDNEQKVVEKTVKLTVTNI